MTKTSSGGAKILRAAFPSFFRSLPRTDAACGSGARKIESAAPAMSRCDIVRRKRSAGDRSRPPCQSGCQRRMLICIALYVFGDFSLNLGAAR